MSSTRQKNRITKLKKVLLIVLGLYAMIGSALYLFQEKFIFLPTVLEQDYKYTFNNDFEEVFLKTDSAAVINAIHFKVKNPKGVILYFHGNAGDLSRWGEIASYFTKFNYDVFVIDYRTYGKSTGPLSEKAMYHDAQFCYTYLKARYSENDIILYGRSLGTGVATFIASENNPKQLLLETPYYSLVDVAKYRFPMFPVTKLMSYTFPTYKLMNTVYCPILIIHGTEDKVVPMSSGKKLYQSINSESCTFIEIQGASHNNIIDYPEYHQAIKTHIH